MTSPPCSPAPASATSPAGLGAHGASKVFVAEDEALAAPLPQPRVDVLARLVSEERFDNVFFASSVLTADIAAGLSARLDAGLNWDLTGIEAGGDGLVGKRPALGDSVIVDAGWSATPRLALFRTGTFEPAEGNGGQPEIVDAPAELEEWSTKTEMVEQAVEEKSGPSIEDADIVVAGGRARGRPGTFRSSRISPRRSAARSRPREPWSTPAGILVAQVGQTGRVVSPKLHSPAGSRAQSSTRSACRAQAPSSPST